MNMTNWAKKEVEIACKKERGNKEENEWDYGCACYESALKAFESLMCDGHSGFSIGVTKQILIRLIEGKPLTPIEDTDDIWDEVEGFEENCKHYQCKRMSSLFKTVHSNGKIDYFDSDRIICFDINNPKVSYYSGFVVHMINEKFPITMPYVPKNPIKVYCKEWLTDRKNGDFDTIAVLYVTLPGGEKVNIKRYFKGAENGYEEIDKDEYTSRVAAHNRRERSEKENEL